MKPAFISVRNSQYIEIERPGVFRDRAWIKDHERHIEKLTPSTRRRLFRVISKVEWSAEERESWYESGYGYDFDETVHFSHPCDGEDKQRWLQWIIAEDMVGETGQGK